MNRNQIIGSVLVAFAIVFAAQYSAMWVSTTKTNVVGKFNLPPERIVKDLDGRAVTLMLNQVWPFDSSQTINVQVMNKRQVDDFVIVVVDVKASSCCKQLPPEAPKEQFSTNPSSKENPKPTPQKLPSKLQLNGKMKLTYEFLDNEWYLLGAENLNLKAIPIE